MSTQGQALRKGHCRRRFGHAALEVGHGDGGTDRIIGTQMICSEGADPFLSLLHGPDSLVADHGSGWQIAALHSVGDLCFVHLAQLCQLRDAHTRSRLGGCGWQHRRTDRCHHACHTSSLYFDVFQVLSPDGLCEIHGYLPLIEIDSIMQRFHEKSKNSCP